jgi:hypothetical protein
MPLLAALPLLFALGVTAMWLSICCPTAAGGTYGYPGVPGSCGCPTAQFIWDQKRVTSTLCGFAEITSPSTPPVYYKTNTISGSVSQTVNISSNSSSGTTGAGSATVFGQTIPPDTSYSLTQTVVDTFSNTYSGANSFANGLAADVGGCDETYAANDAWSALRTTVVSGVIGDSPVESSNEAGIGPGGAESGNTQVDDNPTGMGTVVLEPESGWSSSLGDETQTSYTNTFSGAGASGSVTGTLSNAVDEEAELKAATPGELQFMGGMMGGLGGYNDGTGFRDSVGPDPGDGIDWIGPLWADRAARAVDWATAKYAILIQGLLVGWSFKVTVRYYQAAYAVDATGNPTWGSSSQVGDDVVYTFTPSESWYLLGADAPGGFNPASPDPTAISPTETILDTSSQGFIYGAKIIAVEPV